MQIDKVLASYYTQGLNVWDDYWTAVAHWHFARAYLVVLMPVLVYCVLLWDQRQMVIRHSTLVPHSHLQSRSTFVIVARVCLVLMSTNLTLAIMGPSVPAAVVQRKTQVHNVCDLVDGSGSMKTPLLEGAKEMSDDEAKAASDDPTAIVIDNRGSDKYFIAGTNKGEEPHAMNRADAAQLAARYLIRHRMTTDPANTDRFCLARFDDDFYLMAPLSNDPQALQAQTVHLAENVGNGTNFVVALQKAYDFFILNTQADASRVLIMNTDGLDTIAPDMRQEFAREFKEAHLKVYIIGLGEGWKKDNKLDLQMFADELHRVDPTSGIVFHANNPGDMQKAMETIDGLEKSAEVWQSVTNYREVDDVFIEGTLGFVILFFVFASLAGRNV